VKKTSTKDLQQCHEVHHQANKKKFAHSKIGAKPRPENHEPCAPTIPFHDSKFGAHIPH
jgi:hypothetical protein